MLGLSMPETIIVSGADFREQHGIISIFQISEDGIELKKEIKYDHPFPHKLSIGKGITGLVHDPENHDFWASFSNSIVRIDLNSEEVLEVISEESFNDLHDLFIYDDYLITVNTGNESIDSINPETKEIERIDFLGPDLRKRTPESTMFSSTKPHLHHISTARYNKRGELVVGLFKQQRIINIDNWSQVGTVMESPVHDLQSIGDELFWTTISGKVYSSQSNNPIVDLKDHFNQIGWVRGLYFFDKYVVLGTTSVRDSNSELFSALTGETDYLESAKITVIDSDTNQIFAEILMPDSKFRKIYSIIGCNSYFSEN